MEIRRTANRFLSIFAIVALGVAFYSGIQSAAPDMRSSSDAYFDDQNLMDLKVVGTLGLTEADVEAVSAVEGVALAEPGYMTDAYWQGGQLEQVLHVESILPTMNRLTPNEGRVPIAAGEIFLDVEFAEANGLKVGDSVRLEEEEEEDRDPMLRRHVFTLVGVGSSPLYISYSRGNTTLGTGEIDGIAYVMPEDFASEVYTQIWLQVDGSRKLTAYTDAYDSVVERTMDSVEGIAADRCQIRYEEVLADANEQLADAQIELDDGQKEADEELAKAREELEDGQREIDDGEREIADNEKKLADAQREIDEKRQELEDARQELANGQQEFVDGMTEFQEKESEFNAEYPDAMREIEEGEAQLSQAGATLSQGWMEYDQGVAALQQGEAQAAEGEKQLEEGRARLAEGRRQYEEKKAQVEEGQRQLEEGRQALEEGKSDFAGFEFLYAILAEEKEKYEGEAQQARDQKLQAEDELHNWEEEWKNNHPGEELNADALEEEEKDKYLGLQDSLRQAEEASLAADEAFTKFKEDNNWDETDAQYQSTKAQLEEKQAELDAAEKQLADAPAQLEAALAEIEAGEARLEEESARLAEGKRSIEENREQLESAKNQLESGEAAFSENAKKLQEGRLQLEDAKQQIEDARQELLDSWAELEDGRAQLEDGERQLADAQREVSDGLTSLEDAKDQIADAKRELADGKVEYADAEKEVRQELADGRREIADAREEIEELEVPEWYVTDRSDLPDNVGYGENADRMHNIGKVFPVLFFLVAALISLTTMTRMVEEERSQIGTLKALGYGMGAIAAKYMLYALLATLGGGVAGILLGEKALPYVIITAYGIMYHHMTNLEMPYQLSYALAALGVSCFCTLGATWFACYRELRAVPAVLMRPPAPKSGKRVFLERIPFLWNRLSFTSKSTVRNLFRYKKRFFMTVFGISGCMALMVVGFGLRDSIMGIVSMQYDELQRYDALVLGQTDVTQEEREQLGAALDADGRIGEYARVLMRQVTVKEGKKEHSLTVVVPQDVEGFSSFVCFRDRMTGEEYSLSDEGAILTEKLASMAGLSPGDTLTVSEEEEEFSIPVASVCENYLSHYLYLTPVLYRQTFGEEPAFDEVMLRAGEDVSQEELEDVGRQLLNQEAVLSISYSSSLSGRLSNMLQALNVVIVVLIVSAGMLAFVVLYNLNNININERKRELATLKVLGFYDGEVAAYVYRENVVLTAIGIVGGCLLGALLHRFTIVTVEVDICMFARRIAPMSFFLSGLLTVAFSVFVNWVMYFKLRSIDMIESLKSVE